MLYRWKKFNSPKDRERSESRRIRIINQIRSLVFLYCSGRDRVNELAAAAADRFRRLQNRFSLFPLPD